MLKIVLRTGLVLGVSVALVSIMQYALTVQARHFEIYAAVVALLFTGVGILVGRKEQLIRGRRRAQMERVQTEGLELSSREVEVLMLLRQGLTNQQIAEQLFVSHNTIKTHVASIYSKMNVRKRVEAVNRANELGLFANHPIG